MLSFPSIIKQADVYYSFTGKFKFEVWNQIEKMYTRFFNALLMVDLFFIL